LIITAFQFAYAEGQNMQDAVNNLQSAKEMFGNNIPALPNNNVPTSNNNATVSNKDVTQQNSGNNQNNLAPQSSPKTVNDLLSLGKSNNNSNQPQNTVKNTTTPENTGDKINTQTPPAMKEVIINNNTPGNQNTQAPATEAQSKQNLDMLHITANQDEQAEEENSLEEEHAKEETRKSLVKKFLADYDDKTTRLKKTQDSNTKNTSSSLEKIQPIIMAYLENDDIDSIRQIMMQRSYQHIEDKYKNDLLISAVRYRALKVTKYLLDGKFKPDYKNAYGSTALHFACFNDDSQLAKLLILYGATLEVINQDGKKPCDYAFLQNNHAQDACCKVIPKRSETNTERFINFFK
jgi:hypothetical protein